MKELPFLGDNQFSVTSVRKPGMDTHLEGLWKNQLKFHWEEEGSWTICPFLIAPIIDDQMSLN